MRKINLEDNIVFYEIEDYKHYLLSVKNMSKNTIDAYVSDLNQYGIFLRTYQFIETPEDVSEENIKKYLQSLKRKDLSNKSISRKITAIKDFHNFLCEEYEYKNNPSKEIETPKIEKNLPVVLTVDEVSSMIKSIDTTKPLGKRNKAIIELLYACGLRVSELCTLKSSQINLREKYVDIIGKGDKERKVPMNDECVRAIREYLEQERMLMTKSFKPQLFLNYQGNPLSRQSVFKYIKKLAIDNNIEKEISPHTLRHSFATHLLQGGMDLRIVQEILGHDDISTTEIYTNLDKSYIRGVYESSHPMIKGED